ncbi:uncharacterized protein EV420DRAFT_1038155 [Desarmillaria tabescens]|uniref:Uncharacterized protein n=1 Tax=Armillaria tabescens TaxID=1929756 RepID=A0AA39NF41_ARMTA|nr:uncharacterized protein EV420DRAFT_1038155 [Desarmillaria tabescens]KAK0464359.1 hypothetical protein EV420DRAFT_1038155 [Desarmillaria tabescens]
MLDGCASIIVCIAGVGYAIVSGSRLFIAPQKKIDKLEESLKRANSLHQLVATKLSAEESLDLSQTQKDLIDELNGLDKTRWGHLKNLGKYSQFKKNVKAHCQDVKKVSRRCLAEAQLADAAERAAREAMEKATAQEEEATKKRLQILEQDLLALLGRKFWRQALKKNRSQPGAPRSPSMAGVTPTSFELLNSSNTSLPISVMTPHGSDTPRPGQISTALDGLVLDGDLIDFSDTSLDLGQRDGILIDLSTDDAGSLHRLFSSDSDISYLEGINLLSTLLDSPNAIRIPTEASHPNETPISDDVPPSASGTNVPGVAPVPEQNSENQHIPPKRFGVTFNQLLEGMRTASGCISASTNLYGAIANA